MKAPSFASRATPATVGPKDSDATLRAKLNAGPYAGRPVTDAELAAIKTEADRLLATLPPEPKDSLFIARLKTLPPLEHGAFAGSSVEKPNAYLVERYEALQCALTQPCVASYEESAELVNRSNGSQGISRQGMHARAASRKAQRAIGERIARKFYGDVEVVRGLGRDEVGFFVVVLTRIAPRSLDLTNLDHTFKSVIDGIASGLGIDDRSNLVRYVTTQESGGVREHSVKASLHVSPQGEAP